MNDSRIASKPIVVDASLEALPICVDLDGTLLDGDLLYESLISALKSDFTVLFSLPLWLLQGKAALKKNIAARSHVDFRVLPYNPNVLDFLRTAKAAGHVLVLATASDRRLADGVASHLGLFDQILASDGATNLAGSNKRLILELHFKNGGYHYLGNDSHDLPVWEGAALRSAANASKAVLRQLQEIGPVKYLFPAKPALAHYFRALRPHQWLKNLLIFVPLLAAHKGLDVELVGKSVSAFVAFSALASSVYIVNDLWDLESDRRHRTKSRRPLAAGRISITRALSLACLLVIVASIVSCTLPKVFSLILLAYFFTTCLYSFWLKRKMGVDTVVLTILYSARLMAGGAATGIVLSFWLLCFSQFFFFSLAMIKRYGELFYAREAKGGDPMGRGYMIEDLHQVAMLGSASGVIAAFIVAMFVNSEQVRVLYSSPQTLLLICPLLLYWLSRVWILAGRGLMHDDPIVFALKDNVSYYCGACAAAILVAASIF